jgi:SAM-dependent methyltransferase
LDGVKVQEDTIFADLPPIEQQRPWRRLFRHPWALRFDLEIVDLYRAGRFLELGGESCYASATYKSVFPEGIVYASDVSPNSLRKLAIPTSYCFPGQPDFFLALDAENIPFMDETIDGVFAQAMIHHLPRPVSMLNEVHRILKPGGCFVAIDASVPRHFRFIFAREARNREETWGIQEDLIPYSRWLSMIDHSRLPASSLQIHTHPRHQSRLLFKLMGHVIHRMPRSFARRFFPVGVMIVYRKPGGSE